MLLKIKQTTVNFPLLHLEFIFCCTFILLNGPEGLTGHCIRALSFSCILIKSSILRLGIHWYEFFAGVSIPWLLCVHLCFTTHSASEGKADHDPGSLYDSGFGCERHIAPTFVGALGKEARAPNLVEWSWSSWWPPWLPYWKSPPEKEAKKRRADPRGAKPDSWLHCWLNLWTQSCQTYFQVWVKKNFFCRSSLNGRSATWSFQEESGQT